MEVNGIALPLHPSTKRHTMKTKLFFEISLSENIKGEWEIKEYGSYEDAGKPKEGHIVNVGYY